MIALPPSTGRYWLSYLLRLTLTAAVLYALVLVNQRYFFHTELYEAGDSAANTLAVLRAEHGHELYGPYSRWEFHHPGPALFYTEALGETAFSRTLHLTPTPYNAQELFVTFLLISFLAAGISVAARWVRGSVFLVLALALATLHFTAADERFFLLSTWSAFVIPSIFFALLVAAASVAAGQGEDLPLLALAGCFLLHLHVAQPLFVGPMFLLGYLGLGWSCWRRRLPVTATSPVVPAEKSETTPPVHHETSALPWRVYRRSHWFAVLIAACFALPILVDLCLPDDNLRRILRHLHDHRGEGHSFVASLDYFLRFAFYKPSMPSVTDHPPEGASLHGVAALLLRHPWMFACWAVALLSPLLPLAVRVWRGREPVLLGDASGITAPLAAYAAPAGRWRFLGSLWMVWALSVGLTLYWGRIQDGDLYYFNAWFNYSIWYALALCAAGMGADALDAAVFRAERPWLWKALVILVCAGLAGVTLKRHPERLHADDGDSAENRLQQRTVAVQLSTEPAGTPRAKLLVFPHDAWSDATGLAVLLERAGRSAYVLPGWDFMFGPNHRFPAMMTLTSRPADTNADYEIWHLLPADPSENPPSAPLLANYRLVPGGLPIDPATEPAINWEGETANHRNYVVQGWSEGEDKTSERTVIVQFSPRPVPADSTVRITFDFTPFPFGKRHGPQRLKVRYNGNDLGTLGFAEGSNTPQSVVVPATVWSRYGSVLLTMELPDAASPLATGESADPRPLAFLTHRIAFALLTDANTTVAPVRDGVAPPTPTPSPAPAEPAVIVPAPTEVPAPTQTPDIAPASESMPEGTPSPSPTPGPTETLLTPEGTPEIPPPS